MVTSVYSSIPDDAINRVTGNFIQEPLGNNYSLRGFAYTCQQVTTFAGAGTQDFWFDPTGITGPLVPVLGPFFKTDSADAIVILYFGGSYSGGSEVTSFNRLAGGDSPSGKVISGATTITPGTASAQYLLSSGLLSGGSQTSDQLPFGVSNASPVRVEIAAAGATDIEYRITWFEL